MTPKTLPLLEQCIETGIALGWSRAHKHTDTPTEQSIKQQMMDAIMLELHTWFDFKELPNA